MNKNINKMNLNYIKKKEEEKIIINKFIEAYKYKYDKNVNIKILEIEEAKKKYPDYEGEKPDFIILKDNVFIGIEICQLLRDKIEPLNMDNSEKDMKIINAMHLQDIRKDKEQKILFLNEDLALAALDSINKKVKKTKNYINCPIWLLCYANQPCNLSILSPYFEDNNESKVATYISNNMLKNNRIEKIWLAEFSNKNLLLEIK